MNSTMGREKFPMFNRVFVVINADFVYDIGGKEEEPHGSN